MDENGGQSSSFAVLLRVLTLCFGVSKVEDGTEIVKEGDSGSEFFIIQTGNCHCFKKTLKF